MMNEIFTHEVVRSKAEQEGKSLIPNGTLFAIYLAFTVTRKRHGQFCFCLAYHTFFTSCQLDHVILVIRKPRDFSLCVGLYCKHSKVTVIHGNPKMRKGLLFAKRTFIFAKRTFIMAKTI